MTVRSEGMICHASASAGSSCGSFGDEGALAKREPVEETCLWRLLSRSAIRESDVKMKEGD